MTQDSGSERPQRTVAELLAEYGGTGGDTPRRRRRRAEDDGDSAPQHIIDRVLSDSGKLVPIRDEQQPPARRPGVHRTGEHRPVTSAPAPQQQPPRTPRRAAQPSAQPPAQPSAPAGPPVQQRPPAQQPSQPLPSQQAPAQHAPPAGPAQPPTAYAEPVRPTTAGRRRRPQQQPQQQPGPAERSQQFPAQPPTQTARPVPAPSQQQATQTARPVSPPTGRTQAGPGAPRPRPPAVPDDEAATAVHPPLPEFAPNRQQQTQQQAPQPQPTQQRPGMLPPEATTEEFPPVPGDVPAPQAAPTRRHPPAQQPEMESTQAHAGPYVDDDDDEFGDYPDSGVATAAHPDDEVYGRREDFADADRDDYPDGDYRGDYRDDADYADEPGTGGREWLLMAAQVAAGAIAGAAVWLAFSWLWGLQPVVAVVIAVLLTVGLVLGVRRWRRAEDLQTTVLAVLAGLVVTVSPAALLLLHR